MVIINKMRKTNINKKAIRHHFIIFIITRNKSTLRSETPGISDYTSSIAESQRDYARLALNSNLISDSVLLP